MINNSLAARDSAASVPSGLALGRDPGIASQNGSVSRDLRPPLALWIYVARGLGRIILSVLALPFV